MHVELADDGLPLRLAELALGVHDQGPGLPRMADEQLQESEETCGSMDIRKMDRVRPEGI